MTKHKAHKLGLSALTVVLVTILLGACKDDLNLKPQQSLPPDDALTNIEGIESALTGTYDLMRSTTYYGRNFLVMADVSGDNVYNNLSSNRFVPSYDYERTTFDANPRDIWIQAYRATLSCNSILSNIDNIEAEVDTKNRVKGESLIIRSLALFDMVRSFAQPYQVGGGAQLGVPIITQDSLTISTTTIYRPYRSPVERVYEQIIKDLSSAKQIMKEGGAIGRTSRNAATALLSRIYLYRRANNTDLEAVVTQASEIINSGDYSLIPTDEYLASWGENGEDEAIFEFIFTKNDDRGANNIGRMYLPEGYGDIRPLNRFVDMFADNDVRKGLFQEDPQGVLYINKYPSLDGILGLASPRVIRLAEIYLNRAEAYARLGMYDEAKADLNTIIERATIGTFTPIDPPNDEVLDRILLERSKELFAEGHRSYDIFRTGGDMVRYGWMSEDEGEILFTIKTGDYNSILAIPQRDIDVNGNLVQNPGYVQ
ncbi:membrane protein [Fulvitalea axinellae]|uniref:Membrane protein n=1 Tax=Fulvitalea axinellae TaxID=1182444 RepID=A0AAU9CST2_9BACT|nr:membrane protein [Fulvitalea axinellae]